MKKREKMKEKRRDNLKMKDKMNAKIKEIKRKWREMKRDKRKDDFVGKCFRTPKSSR